VGTAKGIITPNQDQVRINARIPEFWKAKDLGCIRGEYHC